LKEAKSSARRIVRNATFHPSDRPVATKIVHESSN
jgi:hypothetical protein